MANTRVKMFESRVDEQTPVTETLARLVNSLFGEPREARQRHEFWIPVHPPSIASELTHLGGRVGHNFTPADRPVGPRPALGRSRAREVGVSGLRIGQLQ